MADLFHYIPHPHAQLRQQAGPPTVAAAAQSIHGPGVIGRFNARFGLKITVVVGTMWTAYLFTLLALVSAPSALRTGDKIIIVGQNVQAAAADARSQATYDDASAVLAEARQIQAHLLAQDAAIEQILTKVSASA